MRLSISVQASRRGISATSQLLPMAAAKAGRYGCLLPLGADVATGVSGRKDVVVNLYRELQKVGQLGGARAFLDSKAIVVVQESDTTPP